MISLGLKIISITSGTWIIRARNPFSKGRLSTLDLLIEIGSFVKKENKVSV
jgi:hypothetical protein